VFRARKPGDLKDRWRNCTNDRGVKTVEHDVDYADVAATGAGTKRSRAPDVALRAFATSLVGAAAAAAGSPGAAAASRSRSAASAAGSRSAASAAGSRSAASAAGSQGAAAASPTEFEGDYSVRLTGGLSRGSLSRCHWQPGVWLSSEHSADSARDRGRRSLQCSHWHAWTSSWC